MARPLADPNLDRRIAMAVFDLVARHGVDGLGVRLVAEATGLSTGTLNYRFGNKQGLLLAAVDFAYRPPADFREQAPPGDRLRRLLCRYVLRKHKVRVWWRFYFAVVAHAAKDPETAQRLAENRRSLVLFFAAALAAPGGPEAPEPCPPGPRDEAAAERLVALAHGLALRQLTDPCEATFEACERAIDEEIELACASRTTVRL